MFNTILNALVNINNYTQSLYTVLFFKHFDHHALELSEIYLFLALKYVVFVNSYNKIVDFLL